MGLADIGIIISEFVAKTQFLYLADFECLRIKYWIDLFPDF